MRKYLFILFLLLCIAVFAGENPCLKHYGITEGLLTNTVYHVTQDRQGFLWFSTDAGVVRYNGSIFRNFRKKDGLINKDILRTQEDSQGRLWIFSFSGNLHFHWQNRIYNPLNTGFLKEMSSKDFFVGFCEDPQGILYFYTSHGLIYSLGTGNAVKKFKYPALSRLYYITSTGDGKLLFVSQQGFFISENIQTPPVLIQAFEIINVFQGSGDTFLVLTATGELIRFMGEHKESVITHPMFNRKLITAFTDKSGLLWIGTFDQGVFCLDGDRTLFSLPVRQSQMIFEDRDQNIWITSMNEGIDKILPGFTSVRHFSSSAFGGSEITTLCMNGEKSVWIGCSNLVFDYSGGRIRSFCIAPDNLQIDILTGFGNELLYGKRNDMIFAREVLSRKDGFEPGTQRLVDTYIKGFTLSSDNKEFCLHHIKRLFLYRENLPQEPIVVNGEDRIYSVYYNRKNRLIVNQNDVISTPEGTFLVPVGELQPFFGKRIDGHALISSDAEVFNIEGDSLWLVTDNHKINLTARMTFSVSHPVIKLLYRFPHLYFTTRNQVYRIEIPANYTADKEIEVQTIELLFSSISDALIQNDTLFVASKEGLTLIAPDEFEKYGRNVPTPYFTNVQAKERKLDFSEGSEIVLRGNNSVHIDFDAINFAGTAGLFSYRLDGLEKNWNTGPETSVVYKNLSPGNYSFRLRAGTSGSEWSREARLLINIEPALYQRRAFIITSVVLLAFVIGLASRLYIRRLKKSQETKNKLITYEQKALQSMMNPHFIFNSLGSIQNYLLQNKADEASLYLSQFARLIRQNLNSANAPLISLEDETDRLMNYLSLERLRLDDRFDFRIIIDEKLHSDEVMIPSMVIQPFVENAVWHGVSPMNENGQIAISVKRESDKTLRVCVEDNGIGMKQSSRYFAKADHISIGMETTQKRLKLICRQHGMTFEIRFDEATPGAEFSGTRVSFNLPYSSDSE